MDVETDTVVDEVETPSALEDVGADAGTPPAEADPAAEETPSEAAPTPNASAASTASSKALAKFNGDPKALDDHYFSVMSENARLVKEAAARAAAPPKPETPPEPSPDVVAIEKAIGVLSAELDALPATRQKLYSEIRQLQDDALVLKTKTEHADEFSRDGLETKLETLKTRIELKLRDYKETSRDEARLQDAIAAKQHAKKLAERETESERARQQDAEADNARIRKEFPAEVYGHTDSFAAEQLAKLLPKGDAESTEIVRRLARQATAVHLTRNAGIPVEQTGYPQVIKDTVADITKLCERAAKFAISEASKRKTALVSPRSPVTGSAAAAAHRPSATAGGFSDDPKIVAARERMRQRLG